MARIEGMMSYRVVEIARSRVVIKAQCESCKGIHSFDIPEDQWKAWDNGSPEGANIQDAMPDLSANDRELFISGICGKCFDELFADDRDMDDGDDEVAF